MGRRMRILHIALGGLLKAPPVHYGMTEDTGGHIGYVLGAARAQAALPGVSVEIVTRRFASAHDGIYAEPREAVCPGLDIVRLDDGDPAYLSKEALTARLPHVARALMRYLSAAPRPDIVHAHFADAAEVARACCDRWRIPLVYTAHSLAIDKRDAGAGLELDDRIAREAAAIARADAIIASSRDEAERQLTLYPGARPERIHRVMPGIDPNDGDTARALALLDGALAEPARPMIVAVARPVEKKNLPALIDLYAASPLLRARTNLVILAGQHGGDEPEARAVQDRLAQAVREADLGGCIALPPAHDHDDVASIYALAARQRGVFVNPALTEPFGLTLLEASAAGLPVVATAHGGPRDIVALIGHGLTADPATPAFASAVERLIEDSSAWDDAADAARRNAPAWTWDRYARRHLGICRALLRRAPLGRVPTRLLVSDIDNTLTGSIEAARRFGIWRRSARNWTYAVATGRSLSEARFVLGQWELPEPDAFATSVGTEIYVRGSDGLIYDEGFEAEIARGWRPKALRERLARVAGLEEQDPIEFRAFKLSYYGTSAAAARARRAIAAEGLEARVVLSHRRMIDIIPARAGKAAAMRRLAAFFDVPDDAVLAAGDSGNDLDMLRAARRAVAVANASEELRDLWGQPNLMRARAAHAAGVLEAIAMPYPDHAR